jgi:hypothetical protein
MESMSYTTPISTMCNLLHILGYFYATLVGHATSAGYLRRIAREAPELDD